MIKSKYIIFDRNDEYYEYTVENAIEALDKYVHITLGEGSISIKLDMWDKVKTALDTLEQRIELINQIVEYSDYRIERIIANYDYIFGDEINPQEAEQN